MTLGLKIIKKVTLLPHRFTLNLESVHRFYNKFKWRTKLTVQLQYNIEYL
jgi:hypothetical protein